MNVCHTIEAIRQAVRTLRLQRRSIGWIPTMGALHHGHASLVERAQRQGDATVVSVFVNPLQFGQNEDFATYPRTWEQDAQLLRDLGVDVVFAPTYEELFPIPAQTFVEVPAMSAVLCGRSRPTHFQGVTTIVHKLLNVIAPDRAYFGLKDAQQVAIIERMVLDLSIPVHIIRCPTVREADGLAASSRNAYLTLEQRAQASRLSVALFAVDSWLAQHPEQEAASLRSWVWAQLEDIPGIAIDYVDIVTFPDLLPLEGSCHAVDSWMIAVAVRLGTTRLIDNRLFCSQT